MGLDELYRMKGELVTTIEITQAKLQAVNQEIANAINSAPKEDKPKEANTEK